MRVKNFRTTGAADQHVDLRQTLTLIGPNNSGKTNLLQAIQMLFTGFENVYGYSIEKDSPHGKGARTSIVGYFEGDPNGVDQSFYGELDKLYGLYDLDRPSNSVQLYLTFSPSETPTYAFFPNQKRPSDKTIQSQISRLQKNVVLDLLGKFECHFVPSEKSLRELLDTIVTPYVRTSVAQQISAIEPQLRNALDSVAKRMDAALAASGVTDIKTAIDFPHGNLENLLMSFDFYLSDPYSTPLDRKGQGIQSLVFMAALQWVTEMERERGKQSIWLIEEPESFLHPKLSHNATRLLSSLGRVSTVAMTSH